jgi:D-arginine dehydrogenase
LEENSCQDINVAHYHADALAAARRAGTRIATNAELVSAARAAGHWTIETRAGRIYADILVNAAGAWASRIAGLAGAAPIPITPHRRTIVQLATDPPMPIDMPLIMDASERFYFKPEPGGRLWLSPHDEFSVIAHDVAPEELDIAIAIDRFERVVNWRILKKERAWAGLRSFSPDRVPVYGFDDRAEGFFWFAGQGGFGIQTGPAAAAISAGLILKRMPDAFVSNIDANLYSPKRFAL